MEMDPQAPFLFDLPAELAALVLDHCTAAMWPVMRFVDHAWRQRTDDHIAMRRHQKGVYPSATAKGPYGQPRALHPGTTLYYNAEKQNGDAFLERLILVRWPSLVLWARRQTRLPMPWRSCEIAISIGDMDLLLWLRSINCLWDSHAFTEAARRGNIPMLELMREKRCPMAAVAACNAAAQSNNTAVLEWLVSAGHWPDLTVWMHAASRGSMQVLEWLAVRLGTLGIRGAWEGAARHGKLCVIEWLHANGYESISTDHCTDAAQGGHISVVRWAAEHGAVSTRESIERAAYNGHLAVVRYLVDQGVAHCPTRLCQNAAMTGHLDIIKWAHTTGRLAWDRQSVREKAVLHKQTHIVEWIDGIATL